MIRKILKWLRLVLFAHRLNAHLAAENLALSGAEWAATAGPLAQRQGRNLWRRLQETDPGQRVGSIHILRHTVIFYDQDGLPVIKALMNCFVDKDAFFNRLASTAHVCRRWGSWKTLGGPHDGYQHHTA